MVRLKESAMGIQGMESLVLLEEQKLHPQIVHKMDLEIWVQFR